MWRHTGAAAGARVLPDANLPHRRDIAFRLGTSPQFYRELLARLRVASSTGPDGARHFPFAGMSQHAEADWINALLIAWADTGDVLSFYQERLINEGYLRTARDPQSLELLLSGGLGVRRGAFGLAPGDSGSATVTVGLDPGCAALVDVLLSVAETRGMPRRVNLPAGSALRMISPTGEGTTYFETDQAIILRREWNAMTAFVPPAARTAALAADAPGVLLDGAGTGLRQGERILVTGQGTDGRQVALLRTVVSAQSLAEAGVTEVTWVPEIPDPAQVTLLRVPRLFRFRRRLGLFGADAPVLATMSRRRRLDQGVDQGGVARLPSLTTPSAWQARNDTLPAGRFQCVLALGDGDICLGTDDGAYLSQAAAPAWIAAKAGMTQRAITALAHGPSGSVLAGTANGGVFRAENPAGGWDSLAGGFVIDTTSRKRVAAKAALPSEVIRRLDYIAGFPGGAGIVALTDSGLFVQQSTATWLTVTTRAAMDPKTRYADALFSADGGAVALCHDRGVERLTVTGAALPSAQIGRPKSSAGPGKAIASGLAGLLRREEAALLHRARPEPYPDRLRLRALGARKPMALAPLSDRLGAGDLLVGTSIGAVICDTDGGLWGASAGLPLGKDGAPVPLTGLTWCAAKDGIQVLAAVGPGRDGPGGDGQGAGIYRFAPDRLAWDRLTESVPAEGPVLVSMDETGALVSAQTPVPATEWPGFALSATSPGPVQEPAPAPPADPPGTRAVPLDLDTPTQGLAPGGMAVLHDPITQRVAAGALIEAPLLMVEAFGLKRRVSRAWVALPAATDLAGFGRRQSAVYADSTELTPLGPEATVRRPTGLDIALPLAGLITDLATPDPAEDGTAHAARRVRARRGPTESGTDSAAALPAGMPASLARRIAISGRGARVLPALLGGVIGLADHGGGRPRRDLGYSSIATLLQHGAALLAGDADGLVYRTADGWRWQPDSRVLESCGGLHTLLAAGDTLWAAGPTGIASRTTEAWRGAGAIPGKRRITCLARDSAGTLWAGTDSGLFASADNGATWRPVAGGALDPDTVATALLALPDGGLLLGTDGDGVLQRAAGGASWNLFAGPIARGRVTCLAAAAGRVLAGTPDAGAFINTSGQPGWWATGLAPDLVVTAACCTAANDFVAAGAAGLFWRDTAEGTWRELPLGLTGTLTSLLAPTPPSQTSASVTSASVDAGRFPFLLAGAAARLPFGRDAGSGDLRLEPVATLPASLAPLLATGVLGPTARQALVQASLTLAKDAVLAPLPGGTGWSLGSVTGDDAPLYLLPGAEVITVARPSHPPLRVGAAQPEGGHLLLAAVTPAGDPVALHAYPEELLFLPAAAADPLLTCVRDISASQPAEDGASTTVTLDAATGFALDAATLTATANVVGASEGRMVLDEVLGDGSAEVVSQQFRLRQAPLTFLPAPPPLARRSTLTVTVAGQPWREVASFAGTGAYDHVYILGIDATGVAQITFGDGERGARLPTGTGNVRASYRCGMGTMPAPQPLDQQPVGATHLAYLMAGSGGAAKDSKILLRSPAVPPADASAARLALPHRARLRNRLVTPIDYTRVLTGAPGVVQARADSVGLPGARATLLVTIVPAPDAGQGVLARVRAIAAASQAAGARPAQVLACEPVPIRLAVRLWLEDGAVAASVTNQTAATLRQRFGYAAGRLAEDLRAADILAALQRLPGVAGAEISHLHRTTEAEANLPRIVALPGRFDGTACRAAQLAYLSEDTGALMVSAAPRSALARP